MSGVGLYFVYLYLLVAPGTDRIFKVAKAFWKALAQSSHFKDIEMKSLID